MRLKTVLMILAALAVIGCATTDTKEGRGTWIGAGAGALAGYILGGESGAAIGALLGGAIGNRMGAYLDEREKQAALAASQQAVTLPTNEKEHWEVRDEQDQEKVTASGWVTPTTDIYTSNGRRCRDVVFVSQKEGSEYTEQQKLCETPQGWVTG